MLYTSVFRRALAICTCVFFFAAVSSSTAAANEDLAGASQESRSPETPDFATQAGLGIQALQKAYMSDTGLYAAPSGWWNSANALTVLINYSRLTHRKQYWPAVANTFKNANRASGTLSFINDYDDDEGWWALAWIDAYDGTHKQAYLKMAESIFANIASEWEPNTCGGGVWWKKPNEYKNAIANELFLFVAASLANRTHGGTSASYLAWAHKSWAWFKASGMINAQNLVNDGLNSTNPAACTNNGRTPWSYNQGVILGGLVELDKADHDPALLAVAVAIAKATIAKLSLNGVLTESTVSGGDVPQFKGIFVRNLAILYQARPDPAYKTFIEANATSILKNDQGPGHQFGVQWEGPFDSFDATRQSSALDALVSAAEIQ
jgi:predicted alpha-1,6-mannanase (GH76 family)